jgi:hypothetical protein
MKRKDEHRPQATCAPAQVAKRVGEDEPRREVANNLPPTKREVEPVRHERGRLGFSLAQR